MSGGESIIKIENKLILNKRVLDKVDKVREIVKIIKIVKIV